MCNNMIDCHIHIEQGEYTLSWINNFIKTAIERNIDEIWLLEHCYRFIEFVPMYNKVRLNNNYIDKWLCRKAGVLALDNYFRLVESVRKNNYPVKIKFGLEVCYFKESDDFIYKITKNKGLDFLTGSVHFVDNFAFDHRSEFWENEDVNKIYQRFFETSIDLAQSGIYDGIAHPDCIKIFGHKPSFSLYEYYERLALSLAQKNMYAEQNGGAHRRCPHTTELGLNSDFIKSLIKNNVKIQTASDAHRPEDVGMYIAKLENIIKEYNKSV